MIKNIVLNADMETMKLRAHIGADGILQIQTPTDLKDTSVEVVVVVQPLPDAEVAASSEPQARYNAWGKPTTKKSISDAIALMGVTVPKRENCTLRLKPLSCNRFRPGNK